MLALLGVKGITAQVIIRAIAFSFILFVSSSQTSRNCTVSVLKLVL